MLPFHTKTQEVADDKKNPMVTIFQIRFESSELYGIISSSQDR